MKHITHTSLCLGIIMSGFLSFNAQENFKDQERSIVTIERGISLHDEKKYDEAITEFKKVHRNDSNYYLASVEILNTYLALKKNQEGIALCDQLLKLKNDYTPDILVYKGDFLDHLKKYDEAQKIYEKGLKDYPLNHAFYYEMGVLKLGQKKYQEAYDLFIKAIHLNPFHSASHIQMGLFALRNNNITSAMLAYQFSFLSDGKSKRAQGIVSDLEKIAKLELEPDTILSMKIFETENDFTELESILKSKVALTSKYKSKTDLTFDLTKQMQLLIENIGKYKDVKGFYNEFYGSFFTELQNAKHFESFAYFSLRGMELEKVNKWLAKNKDEETKFELWSYNYMCQTLAKYPENLNGKIVSVPHWFSNNFITAAGIQTAQGQNDGYWNFYYKNGIKKSEGEFANGKRNKTWKFYTHTGGIKEETTYENGLEKLYKSFYENENPSIEVPVQNDKMNGQKKSYFSNGNLASITDYKDGIINGKQTYYYRNGSSRYTIKNVNNVLSGDLVEYFDNGKIYQKATLLNSNREGASKTFWNNAGNTVESEGSYIKNEAVGEWKNYYRSGQLHKQYTYNNEGKLEGTYKTYFENGKLESDEVFANGKRNGVSKEYTDDGILWQEFVYKKEKLLEYRAFKKDGTKICDNKINGKNFQVVLYHPKGTKRREGKVSDGELEGTWKDYSSFGVLIRETNYKEGAYEGKSIEYYTNGKVKKDQTYVAGSENGYYKSFHNNGTVETEGMVVNGDNEGYWKTFHPDGILSSYTYYTNGNIDGWNEYYDVNGKLSSEDLYEENCLIKVVYHDTSGLVSQNIDLPGGSGTLERLTPEGKTIYKKQFVKDYAEGSSKTFYADGKTESEVEFKKGKREGKSFVYNGLGTVTHEVSYFNNKKEGKEAEYLDNGKLKSEYFYVNGDYHGHCFSYFENGKIYRDVNYEDGDAEGASNMYDETGELTYSRVFHNDLLVSYTYKDTKGQLLKPMELNAGDSKVLCYYQNGKKSFEATYTNGDLNGKRIIYYSNGKIMDESDFYFDSQTGISKEYYTNGTIKLTESFFYGKREGKTESFYEDGKLKSEKNYKKGTEHGWFKYYDATGKLLKSILYYNGEVLLVK